MGLFGPHGRCRRRDGAPWLNAEGPAITNRVAIYLIAVLICLIAVDGFAYDWAGSTFMARKFLDLLDWTKFWR